MSESFAPGTETSAAEQARDSWGKLGHSMEHSVASAIGGLLAAFGARRCFGVAGSNNFAVTHALVRAGVKYIAARHEGNAVTMADVYARMTDELTLVSLHAGPGLTNGLTGIAEAAKSRTPLLVLAGDVESGAVHSNFYFDQAEAVRSVGAVAERIHTPATALEDAKRAVARALFDRRTVVLSLPLDVQDALLDAADPMMPAAPLAPLRPYPDPAAIASLVEAIVRASRPLVLAGRGAVAARAKNALLALGEQIGALFATTIGGHGLFSDSPWSLGICGGFASPAAMEIVPECDLILAFGAGLTRWTTGKGTLLSPSALIAQIDTDIAHLGLQHPVQLPLVGDASATAEALLMELGSREPAVRLGWRSETTRQRIAAGGNHQASYDDVSGTNYLDPRSLSKAIDNILPADRIVVTDAGHWMGWAARYLRVRDERSWCMPLSFQSIGLGLASAIGASISQPERLVLLAAGDGGFMMSLADFETAVRLNRRLCILIYNDSAYGAEVHHFGRLGYSTEIAEFPDTDLAAIARGFGAEGVVIRRLEDLDAVADWVERGASGVFLIDARISRTLEADWHRRAFSA